MSLSSLPHAHVRREACWHDAPLTTFFYRNWHDSQFQPELHLRPPTCQLMSRGCTGGHRGVFVMVGKGISWPFQKWQSPRGCVRLTDGDGVKHDFIEILSFSGNAVDLMVPDLYPCIIYIGWKGNVMPIAEMPLWRRGCVKLIVVHMVIEPFSSLTHHGPKSRKYHYCRPNPRLPQSMQICCCLLRMSTSNIIQSQPEL